MVSVLTPQDAEVAFKIFDSGSQGVLGREDLILALERAGHKTKDTRPLTGPEATERARGVDATGICKPEPHAEPVKAGDIDILAAGSTSKRAAGGQLHCEAFKAMTAEAGRGLDAKECLQQELDLLFSAAGAAGDGAGLNAQQLIKGLQHVGWEADEKEAQYLIEQFDKDGDGLLSKVELLDLLR
eukprot:TRINITY_DN45775_c0_g1_i1.p1 TRINITY_DN45775_c0_g1~~TRINITY_DN45775_c0_g1_i1.p1  ORF type:complete len:185 (+),score=57.48 TRINITY_DN45775_c0_g1_i1:108-662(+)